MVHRWLVYSFVFRTDTFLHVCYSRSLNPISRRFKSSIMDASQFRAAAHSVIDESENSLICWYCVSDPMRQSSITTILSLPAESFPMSSQATFDLSFLPPLHKSPSHGSQSRQILKLR